MSEECPRHRFPFLLHLRRKRHGVGQASDQQQKRMTIKSLTFKLALVTGLVVLCQMAAVGAPFAKKIPFTQPDGTQIMLWGQGDEFYAVFETLDGYTVMFNQQTKAYDYAGLSAGGDQLISTGVAVGQGNPAAMGLQQHLRIKSEAAKTQAAERFARWDQAMGITRRWKDLKAERRLAELTAAQDGPGAGTALFNHDGSETGADPVGRFQRRYWDHPAGGNRQFLQRRRLHRVRQQRLGEEVLSRQLQQPAHLQQCGNDLHPDATAQEATTTTPPSMPGRRGVCWSPTQLMP